MQKSLPGQCSIGAGVFCPPIWPMAAPIMLYVGLSPTCSCLGQPVQLSHLHPSMALAPASMIPSGVALAAATASRVLLICPCPLQLLLLPFLPCCAAPGRWEAAAPALEHEAPAAFHALNHPHIASHHSGWVGGVSGRWSGAEAGALNAGAGALQLQLSLYLEQCIRAGEEQDEDPMAQGSEQYLGGCSSTVHAGWSWNQGGAVSRYRWECGA